MEGPRIILEVLRQAGVSFEHITNHDHDLVVFRENVLADGLTTIARRWQKSRMLLHMPDAPTEVDTSSASVVGTVSSTAGGTLVEVQDESAIEAEPLLIVKLADESGTEMEQSPGDAAMGETVSPSTLLSTSWLSSQDVSGQDAGVEGIAGCDVTDVFQSSIEWPEEDT